jgi:hypothetical protein
MNGGSLGKNVFFPDEVIVGTGERSARDRRRQMQKQESYSRLSSLL